MTKVLVIDDDLLFLRALKRLLSSEYEVLSASDGATALKIVGSESRIDLVVCDIVLPEMSGPQLVSKIALASPATAFVLMTGKLKERGDLPKGLAILHKPFSADQLFSAIDSALTIPQD